MTKWKSVSSINDVMFLKNVPKESGVYVIYFINNGVRELRYIGSAVNIKKRLHQHGLYKYATYNNTIKTLLGRTHNVLIKYKTISDNSFLSLERNLISRLNPPSNKLFKRRLNG